MILTLALLLAADAEPAPKKLTDKELAAAEKAAKDHLEKLKGDAGAFAALKDDAVAKALPGHAFYTVLFRQFPVGRIPPEGLKVSNVFAADAKGKVTVITSAKELEKFLSSSMPVAASEAAKKDAARAAVRLGQELHQDGFYKFKADDDATKAEKGKASAKATVMSGGSGSYAVALTFTDSGKVSGLEEKAAIKPGPRPICQATKLLDADPIVRGMAEQALLCMGRASKPYLMEQRAKASPELRGAIDRMWRKIAAAGW